MVEWKLKSGVEYVCVRVCLWGGVERAKRATPYINECIDGFIAAAMILTADDAS